MQDADREKLAADESVHEAFEAEMKDVSLSEAADGITSEYVSLRSSAGSFVAHSDDEEDELTYNMPALACVRACVCVLPNSRRPGDNPLRSPLLCRWITPHWRPGCVRVCACFVNSRRPGDNPPQSATFVPMDNPHWQPVSSPLRVCVCVGL